MATDDRGESKPPIPVKLMDVAPALHDAIKAPLREPSALSPTTTEEEQRVTAGQRSINRVWEYTQSAISLMVVTTTALGVLAGRFQLANSPLPAEWWTIVGLVIGFYFSRTNHTKVGGVTGTLTDER